MLFDIIWRIYLSIYSLSEKNMNMVLTKVHTDCEKHLMIHLTKVKKTPLNSTKIEKMWVGKTDALVDMRGKN